MREGRRSATARNPTLLYGYGGFEISMTPGYCGGIGAAWLERGGVYVLANIRGGGEFGPAWHQAALQGEPPARLRRLHRRGRGPDRAQDHVARSTWASWAAATAACWWARASRSARTVQRGGLPGAAARHEALQQAAGRRVVDGRVRQPGHARRLGTASRSTRPYQNVDAGRELPARASSTPRRATTACIPATRARWPRKMMAQGHDVLYYENIEGGHGGAADNAAAPTCGR